MRPLIYRDHFGEQHPVIRQGLADTRFARSQLPHPSRELGDGHAGDEDLRPIVGEDCLDLFPAGFLAMVSKQRGCIEQVDQPSASRSAANSATLSRRGENRLPAPNSRRASSSRRGMTRTTISSLPSTGCQSSFQPGLMPNRRATSTGMVTMFFWVTVVIMD